MKLDSACFYTTDVSKVKDFYLDFIGATLDYEVENKFISFNFPNGLKLAIKVGDKPREIGGHGTIFVRVPNIEEWY